jgi:methionyl-tRNA synthetase
MDRCAAALDALDLQGAADIAWELVTAANQYIVQTAPWALAKAGNDADLDTALAALARCLFRLTLLVGPFLPSKSTQLWQALGQTSEPAHRDWLRANQLELAGTVMRKPPALFPRPGVEPEA